LALLAVPAVAQPVISAKSGVVDYLEGRVFLGDQQLDYSPTHFTDIKENQILRTEEGRAEILLTPGVVLRLAENSSIRMVTNRLIDTRLELLTGSASVEADQIAKDNGVTIACKDGQVTLTKAPGVFRFDAEPARVRIFKGAAEVTLNGQTVEVTGGRMAMLSGTLAEVQKFDVNDTDSLDNWSRRRGEYMAMANVSAAKTLLGSGSLAGLGWGMGQPCMGVWGYNQWYGMMTYIPCMGSFMNPWGFPYWSPYTVGRAFYGGGYGGYAGRNGVNPARGGYNAGFPYPAAAATSSGYSGAMVSASSTGSRVGTGSSSMGGSTASGGAASGGSAGHGGGAASGGASGGHGR
jgi:hypothetical protein